VERTALVLVTRYPYIHEIETLSIHEFFASSPESSGALAEMRFGI